MTWWQWGLLLGGGGAVFVLMLIEWSACVLAGRADDWFVQEMWDDDADQ